ncbi:MAG: aldolase/citrate lyase family protein [Candidatus Omnitrophica bacterium]|nr:aldolase/citrate lyase family protein [Candidatus Omnitrophota bacterium]
MKKTSLKDRLKSGEILLGSWNIIPSAALVEIIGYSGLDFIVIDSEHGSVNIESAENLIRAAEITGMPSILRVPCNEPNFILRALDIGACGIQIPHVSTEAQARLAVESAKYHPKGKRGFSPFTRAARYGLDAQGYTNRSNDKTTIVLNIEGIDGVRNLKKIVKVVDIDVIFIGPYDLSQSLGKPGQIEDKEIIKYIRQSVKTAEAQGLACGSFAPDMKYLEILLDCGVRYLTYMVDSDLILNSYKTMHESIQRKITQKMSR